jgi:integrase
MESESESSAVRSRSPKNFQTIGSWKKVRTVGPRTCNVVFDQFLKHCESRVAKKDLAYSTYLGYVSIIDSVWRPEIGEKDFESIRCTDLWSVVDGKTHWTKKTYNNATSAIRCAFEFGYLDLPEKRNPAERIKTRRVTSKDRPPVDPFSAAESESVIAAIHRDWGEAQGNYDEFRFFTGVRLSEQLALLVSDVDLAARKLRITKAYVAGREKDRTKTNVDRVVDLCPRAYECCWRSWRYANA